jgi:hypothetical protein
VALTTALVIELSSCGGRSPRDYLLDITAREVHFDGTCESILMSSNLQISAIVMPTTLMPNECPSTENSKPKEPGKQLLTALPILFSFLASYAAQRIRPWV